METYYSTSFLIYTHVKYRWIHQILGEKIPQLDIFCNQVKPPVTEMGYT